MRQYFKIQNKKSDERAQLYIYGQIGKDWWTDEGISDKDVTEWLNEAAGKPLDVHINSVGGNVYEGIAIHNALKNYGDVNTYNDGLAASISSVIMLAGKNRFFNNGSQLMVHGVSGGLSVYGSKHDIKDAAENYIAAIEACEDSILNIYETGTNLSRDELINMMSKDTYLSPDNALAKGFCTHIINKTIDKTQENSLREQMGHYPFQGQPNIQMQAVINRLFSATNPETTNKPIFNNPVNREGSMPKTNDSQEPTNVINPEALKAQAIADFKAAENKRQTDIKAIFGDKHPELMNQCLLDQECSPENAKDKLLDNLLNAPQPNNAQPVGGLHAQVTEDQSDKKLQAIAKAWDDKRDGKFDATNEMRGATMHTAISAIAAKHGVNTAGYTGQQLYNLVAGDMQVTTDFSVLLSDSLNKSVLTGYNLASVVFRNFVKFGNFNDFRKHEVHMLGTIGDLPLKDKENDEYKQIKLPDSEAQDYAPEERGGIIMLSRKLIINNDLDNLETQARDTGMAGALTLEKLFFNYLFSNPQLKDKKALFHKDHGNLLAASAPTEEALLLMQELFDGQTAPNSPDSYLALFADRVLGDRKVLGMIRELITKETGKEAKETIDMFAKDKLFFSQRMANKGVYFFADPNIAPVLEVGFLNGQQVPTLATEEHFDSGAMKWRLQLDCGIGAVNYRGAVFMPYAAPVVPPENGE